MNPAHPHAKLAFLAALLAAVGLLAAGMALGTSRAEAGGGLSADGGVDPGQKTVNGKKYARLWKRTPRRQKRWANRTARCESGRDPKAIGGGGKYRGAFQFRKDTWRRAPKSPGGDPIRFNYKTQAVVAVALKRRDGAHHWPTCG